MRVATSHRSAAKIAIPNSCGRSASAGAASAKTSSPRIAAIRGPAPRAIDAPIEQPSASADQPGTEHREQLPATDAVAERQQHLGQPLLVRPRRARPP